MKICYQIEYNVLKFCSRWMHKTLRLCSRVPKAVYKTFVRRAECTFYLVFGGRGTIQPTALSL